MPTMATLAVKHHLALVGAGEAKDVFADVVEHHLAGDGYCAQHADERPHRDEIDVVAEAAAAVDLDGQVAGFGGGLRGGELRHVSIRGGRDLVAAVEQPGGVAGHEGGQLKVRLRHGQGVLQPLVGADGLVENHPLPGVGQRLLQHELPQAHGHGGGADSLRIEGIEQVAAALALVPNQVAPGARLSTMSRERPSRLSCTWSNGVVRATTSRWSDSSAPLMNIFWPLST